MLVVVLSATLALPSAGAFFTIRSSTPIFHSPISKSADFANEGLFLARHAGQITEWMSGIFGEGTSFDLNRYRVVTTRSPGPGRPELHAFITRPGKWDIDCAVYVNWSKELLLLHECTTRSRNNPARTAPVGAFDLDFREMRFQMKSATATSFTRTLRDSARDVSQADFFKKMEAQASGDLSIKIKVLSNVRHGIYVRVEPGAVFALTFVTGEAASTSEGSTMGASRLAYTAHLVLQENGEFRVTEDSQEPQDNPDNGSNGNTDNTDK